MTEHVVKRITRVSLKHFRGFVGSEKTILETDADIVLLLGPNGTGKTSFIEALQLLLTGMPTSRERGGQATDGFASLLAVDSAKKKNTEEKNPMPRHKCFELEAEVLTGGPDDPPKNASNGRKLKVSGTLKKEDEENKSEKDNPEVMLCHLAEPESESWIYPPDPFENADTTKALPTDKYEARTLFEGAALQARLTAFFQHDVGHVFDDAAEAQTVLDLVAPIPARIRLLSDAFGWIAESIDKKIEEEGKTPKSPQESDRDALKEYRVYLEELLVILNTVAPAHIELPDGSDATELAHAVDLICRAWKHAPIDLLRVPASLAPIIANKEDDWYSALEKEARGSAGEADIQKWETRRADINEELEELRERRPNLDREHTAFRGAVVERHLENGEIFEDHLPGLLLTVEALEKGLDGWLEAAQKRGWGPSPDKLKAELSAVRGDALGAFVGALREWTQKLQEDLDLRSKLQKEQRSLDEKVRTKTPKTEVLQQFPAVAARARNVPRQEWERLLKWEDWEAKKEQRENRKSALTQLKEEVEECQKELNRLREYNKNVLKQLKDALTEITVRFSIAGRQHIVVEVEETPIGGEINDESGKQQAAELLSARAKLYFDDGRGLAEFSSGQNAQMAVGFMVAQNLLVAQGQHPLYRGMPHRVLLLDDVSGTYDLTNLMREVILWRQLAYTDKPRLKRQIFLSSHHEDLTNQLIDHLVPPEGCSMQILRFKEWDAETGPIIETLKVEPVLKHDNKDATNAFKKRIEELFHGA